MTKLNRRWALGNKRTFKLTRSFTTRAAARNAKGANHFIYDTVRGVAVR